MDFNIKKKSETKQVIEVTISVEEMEKYIQSTSQKMAQNMNIKGFRPGNAPFDVIENTVGKEKLFEEAAKDAVQDTYPKIIEEKNLFTLSSPQVDLIKCAPGNEVVYTATVYTMPIIELPDYKEIAKKIVEKESGEVKVEEKEVDQAINKIRENKAKLSSVDREAKKGDLVVINFKGVFQGNEEKKVEEKNFRVVLGGGDLDMLYGFEENILGMKGGERKDFSVEAPSENALLEGKKETMEKQVIDFEVELISVMERELPEINDDFAKTFPNIENLEDMKKKIEEGMRKEKERKDKEKIKVNILKKIKEETSFEVPEILIDKEVDNMQKTIENQLMQNGNSFDNYLKEIKKTEEELKKEWRPRAEENVSFALILHKISQEEKIDVSNEEIEKEIDRHFNAIGKNKESEKAENMERMRMYVHDTLKNQKVFQTLSIDDA